MREKYHLKTNPKAFFRPKVWNEFYNALKEKQKPYFKIVINTGARINEIRHLKVADIDFENKTLTFYITKVKSRLGEKRSVPREIKLSGQFLSWLQRWIRTNKLKQTDTFNIPTTAAIRKTLGVKLSKMNVRDWEDFSSHNCRKTHGTWLMAMGIDGTAVAARLGHDANTLLKSYASPDIFTEEDKVLIKDILGDLV